MIHLFRGRLNSIQILQFVGGYSTRRDKYIQDFRNRYNTDSVFKFRFCILTMFTLSPTATQSSALKCSLKTFAPPTATIFAATMKEHLCRFWKRGPADLPTTCRFLDPPPVTWRRNHRAWDHNLCPDVPCLVNSPLCTLDQRCSC